MWGMLSLPDFPVRQRDFLLEISRAITERLDLSVVLKRVLYASVVMLAGRAGVIALRNEADKLFYVRALTGINKERAADINRILHELVPGNGERSSVGKGFSRDLFSNKLMEMARLIDEVQTQPVAMPLVFAGEPLGVLVVFRSYQSQVTPNDMQILQSFADQAAIAVNNAQMYQHIDHERQRLAAILQHSGDGVMILDPHLNILQVNQAFEQMTGWVSEDAVGLSVDDVVVWERIEQRNLRDAIANGWPHQKPPVQSTETFYVEGELSRRDGLVVSIGITYAPLFANDGTLANVIANIRDITNFRRSQEMQNVFISMVSHELRTPVALIKGYSSTLNRDDAKWDVRIVRDSLAVIEEEADRLSHLIDDLLTASKLQTERTVSLQLADVRLDNLAARSVERISTQTQNHSIELSFPPDFPSVQGDAGRLRQVIDNLLTNAIKYSPKGGTITVGGRYTDQNVTFFVRDEGVGIPDAALPQVFDRFYRVESDLKHQTKGTGLGLYLVKAIIEAHAGRINVKSQVGHGSTFYFSIPRD